MNASCSANSMVAIAIATVMMVTLSKQMYTHTQYHEGERTVLDYLD